MQKPFLYLSPCGAKNIYPRHGANAVHSLELGKCSRRRRAGYKIGVKLRLA